MVHLFKGVVLRGDKVHLPVLADLSCVPMVAFHRWIQVLQRIVQIVLHSLALGSSLLGKAGGCRCPFLQSHWFVLGVCLWWLRLSLVPEVDSLLVVDGRDVRLLERGQDVVTVLIDGVAWQ